MSASKTKMLKAAAALAVLTGVMLGSSACIMIDAVGGGASCGGGFHAGC
jgi:hypothetical protein